jgi:hypothetical protein
MMNIRTFYYVPLAFALFASCQAVLPPAEQAESGRAAVTIALTTGGARTVLPQVSLADVSRFSLSGAASGGAAAELASFTSSAGAQVFLEPGTWDFILNAYNIADALILQGSAQNQTISLSGGNRISFTLFPLESGQGSISIRVDCPAVFTRVSASVEGGAESGANLTLNDTASGKRAVYAETRNAGSYFIVLRFYDEDDTLRGVVSELAVVAGNLSSAKTLALAEGDLKAAAGGSLNVANSAGFASALASIQGNTRDTSFTITATADFALDPQDLSGAAYQNKTITIKGDTPGRIITLNSVGSLFTVGADVALEVENITLQGRSDNNAALVTVNTDGRLALNAGGKITGNTYTTSVNESGGAGVYVDGGTLEIAGGEVSGNTLTGSSTGALGGGILVANGSTITMTGGTIRGNSITTFHSGDGAASGGGIALYSNSSFVMTAGIIEGNIIDAGSSLGHGSEGGGLSCWGSSFVLENGTIRNNICRSDPQGGWGQAWGSGVFIRGYGGFSGRFVMEGGVISGNNSICTVANYGGGYNSYRDRYTLGAYGGGVALLDWSDGYNMEKTGGIIYGGEVTGNDADGYPLANTAQSDSNGLGGGHAAYADNNGTTIKLRRNATAYAGDNISLNSSDIGSGAGWD